ncbi:MAG: alpha-1,4-glucan--maltose-1-phosphate maltosyltransferase, partial [Chthoniobacterales bacterium]
PGNLRSYITRINEVRKKHSSLSELTNLTFHDTDKDNVIAFSKRGQDGDALLVVVNLNPFFWEESTLHLDLAALGVGLEAPFEVHDVISDTRYV